jgi:hypothetical protein
MNIFVLDNDIRKCAQYHNNAHVVKMILESAQLLCTAHWKLGSQAPYKATHANHPCGVWVRESKHNYLWLCKLALQLCAEFEFRYGKKHKTKDVILYCLRNVPNYDIIDSTPFAQAMPNDYKCDDAVEAYRNYYMLDKRHLADWGKRGAPDWWF